MNWPRRRCSKERGHPLLPRGNFRAHADLIWRGCESAFNLNTQRSRTTTASLSGTESRQSGIVSPPHILIALGNKSPLGSIKCGLARFDSLSTCCLVCVCYGLFTWGTVWRSVVFGLSLQPTIICTAILCGRCQAFTLLVEKDRGA
jgi:hypothetical protein